MLRDIPRGVLFAALTAVACREAPVSVAPEPPARVAAPPVAGRAAAIAHGGVGSPPDRSDGCRRAVDAALAALEKGADPVDAAVAGVMVMEDDPRFNAGTGSRVRIDGATVQMDASVMTSEGRFAAVAVIEQVKNPVAVARAVLDTPHLVLAGEGATAFARTLGMAPYDPATDEMRRATADIQAALLRNDPKLPPEWRTFDWRARWNFERSITEAGLTPGNPALPPGSDTVGVAVRAADGRFAAALSTGGTSVTLRGRVGDVPIYGAGLFASPAGAVAATGVGERIIEESLARTTNGFLGDGASAADAARRAVALVTQRGTVGIVVMGATDMAAAADREMAWAGREAGSTEWAGP
jgi:isoaspartyl peptidase/L-asparaginase-like protein (Ntn-hydrolase superfamily)